MTKSNSKSCEIFNPKRVMDAVDTIWYRSIKCVF